jgi:formamidopyrimidine-DNA glycosylase
MERVKHPRALHIEEIGAEATIGRVIGVERAEVGIDIRRRAGIAKSDESADQRGEEGKKGEDAEHAELGRDGLDLARALHREPAYADLRGATRCVLIPPDERAAVIARLGADPLRPDADPDRAWARIGKSNRPIGDLLMDQEVIAGVGNVYRAEVLFRHRLDPQLPGRDLRRAQWDAIWADLVDLLADGYRSGVIETLRPEHAELSDGPVDVSGKRVYVYRRTGEPCLLCGTPVAHTEHAARNLFWCPRCQSKRRVRRARRAGQPAH